MKIVDLSLPTEASPSERFGVKMTSLSHDEGVGFFCSLLGCSKDDFPGGRAGAGETVSLNSHSGTHIDAPWHYAPTSEGRRARMIDEMPPEWFFNDGVVLDMRHKPAGSAVTVGDIEACLDKMAYTLKPFDIILLQTGADKYWGKADYADKGCGLLRESTFWLLDRGAKVIGTDAWGLDRPFWAIKDEFGRTGKKEILWEAHLVGIEREYCQIEKLANLDLLPAPTGFKVACFPIKLKGAGAAWCRAVAILP